MATLLLEQTRQGDPAAARELLGVVYQELRALAGSFFGSANPRHTLQPTALVHEAYMKLVNAPNQEWEGRRHFVAVAAKAMRQILANHARDKHAQKRGGGAHMVTLGMGSGEGGEPADFNGGPSVVDAMALEEAMTRLEEIDPEMCRIVELRFFAGLSVEETATVMEISDRTVKREWRMAKAQLLVLLGNGATE
jgi:RNA polymerase sigma factor (TIGR02999 family)